MPFERAYFTSRRMSSMCCAGCLCSCWVQCFSEPFASRLMVLQPHSATQSTLFPPSMNPSTSTRSSLSILAAKLQIMPTASRSPSDTRADATSMRSTFRSLSSMRAMMSFSWGRKLTPLVCSPSRSVESMISTKGCMRWNPFTCSLVPIALSSLCSEPGSRCRRVPASDSASYSR